MSRTPASRRPARSPLFHLPRNATARARCEAKVVGYTVQAFRERLGTGGVRELIEHRPLDDDVSDAVMQESD